ncbi:class I lanthipeptide [Pontimicrobium sp. MEBiC06410]
MKTQKLNGLDFKRSSIVELNESQLTDVNGGSTPLLASSGLCLNAAAALSSASCGAVGAAIVGAVVGAVIAEN